MAIINVEAQLTGSSEAQSAVIRRFCVSAVLRGASANSPGVRPEREIEPKSEPPKQGA